MWRHNDAIFQLPRKRGAGGDHFHPRLGSQGRITVRYSSKRHRTRPRAELDNPGVSTGGTHPYWIGKYCMRDMLYLPSCHATRIETSPRARNAWKRTFRPQPATRAQTKLALPHISPMRYRISNTRKVSSSFSTSLDSLPLPGEPKYLAGRPNRRQGGVTRPKLPAEKLRCLGDMTQTPLGRHSRYH